MGSAKFQIQKMKHLLWLAIYVMVAGFPIFAMGSDIIYSDTTAIEEAARNSYIGGYTKYTLVHNSKTVFIVIGMPSSGIETSEILVYNKMQDGRYRLMLARYKLFGLVSVKEENDAIVFTAKTPILVLPWAGVIEGMEQRGQPRGSPK